MAQLIQLDIEPQGFTPTIIGGYRRIPGGCNNLLTRTSKMPGDSFSLPAVVTCPYGKFGEGTICDACYARPSRPRGVSTQYNTNKVKRAQANRFSWVRQCMKSSIGRSEFVSAMVDAIGSRRKRDFFRVHDSGDFFTPQYVECWSKICGQLPDTRFWAPTRSWKANWLSSLVELNSLENVAVRPSADYFDEAPPIIPGLAAGSTARGRGSKPVRGCFECPAYKQGGTCGDCRVCWNSELSVAYLEH